MHQTVERVCIEVSEALDLAKVRHSDVTLVVKGAFELGVMPQKVAECFGESLQVNVAGASA